MALPPFSDKRQSKLERSAMQVFLALTILLHNQGQRRKAVWRRFLVPNDINIYFVVKISLTVCPIFSVLLSNAAMALPPEACSIKNYGFVIYGKWTDFVVS